MKRKRQKSGFTLVELLVVISIIALLLAILMPSLSAAREQAKRIVCASRLHNQSLALGAYAADYGKYPIGPFGGRWPFGGMANNKINEDVLVPDTDPAIGPAGQGLLIAGKYIDDFKFFYCPASPRNYLSYDIMFEMYQREYLDTKKIDDIDWANFYINYPYWIGFARHSNYQNDPKFENVIKSTVRSPQSRGNKVAISDNIISAKAPNGNDYHKAPNAWANHIQRGQLPGGNVLYNGGNVEWRNMRKLEQNPDENLRLLAGSYAYPMYFWF